ncbi:MAG: biopolymer transporter ExbB [Proteobacteria bacterium]|nr:biopolymer transporter ExbB [Pseudomonadota bacterium]MDA1293886.1 biopolymer transporter ExbB [Pseudomonadota bacterium]
MDQTHLKLETQFTQPVRQITMMLAVVAMTTTGAIVAAPSVLPIFFANLWLNGFIVLVFFIGVASCFAQVFQLISSVRWIENFVANRVRLTAKVPKVLAPLATLLGTRSSQMKIAATSTQSILDSVSTRIEEAREITRYIVNLLIFLGLLGTFYGLATTVPALVETIRSLAPRDGEAGFEVFSRLMDGLESQLDGMGVAFASSLLGLAGSLVVGLLELFAGHGQNRFYRDLEEWLSSITRLGFASGEAETSNEQDLAASIFAQMTEQLEHVQDIFVSGENSRAIVDQRLGTLAEALNGLTRHIEANTPSAEALNRVAEGQERLLSVLAKMERSDAQDAESRMRLRSIDVQLLRLLEEISTGRQETTIALRQQLERLTSAILMTSEQEDKGN